MKDRMKIWVNNQDDDDPEDTGTHRIERLWSSFMTTIIEVADQCFDPFRGGYGRIGYDKQIALWVRERSAKLDRYLNERKKRKEEGKDENDDSDGTLGALFIEYVSYRRQVVKEIRKKRRYKASIEYKQLESLGQRFQFWNKIRKTKQKTKKKDRIPILIDKCDGSGLTSTVDESLEEWKKHFESIGKQNPDDPRFDNDYCKKVEKEVNDELITNGDIPSRHDDGMNRGQEGMITRREVRKAIMKSENKKAAGPDNMKAELIKAAGRPMVLAMRYLFQNIFTAEIIPQQWSRATIVPLYKGGRRADTKNYRPIALMSVIAKMYEKVLSIRLESYVEGHRGM
jgi:hypothetical protein